MRIRWARDGLLRRLAWRAWRAMRTTAARLDTRARPLPSLLVIGAQRAGTTSLHHYLAQHPLLAPPTTTKGVHWFDVGWDRPRSWYRAHFPRHPGPEVRTFESSPYYLFHPEVPGRVATALPGVRVVAVLRDPVDRAWSQYQHEFARGFEDEPFDRAVELEPARLRGAEARLAADPLLVDEHHRHHAYRGRSTYAPQVARWYEALGRDRVLLVDNADLADDPQSVVDRVAAHLGLPPSTIQPRTRHNARRYPPLDDDLRARLREQFTMPDAALTQLTGQTFRWMDP